ncbi:hypothetical protein [Stappia sp. ICDLI1TA098]
MTAKKPHPAETTPRPDLGALYKPVGISAVTAATLCRKPDVRVKAGTGR